MFTRTNAGLANEHLFHDVEFIVYCEGSPIDGEASSLDEVFWQRIFSQNGRNVHCKSSGSKTMLTPLVEKVINEGVSNVVIALDRDYDDLRGILIDHPQVIYTFGYSWESDVMLDFNFRSALALFVTTTNVSLIQDDFNIFFEKQSNQLRRIFALDYKYIAHTEKLFDRQKPISILSIGNSSEPSVKVNALLEAAKTMGNFQTAPLPPQVYRTACGIRLFFGKSVSRLIFHWFSFRTRRINGSRKAHYDTFMSILSDQLDIYDTANARNNYYANMIARI